VLDDDDPVEAVEQPELVRDHDDLLVIERSSADVPGIARVEEGGRFIRHQDLRFGDEHGGEREELFLPSRKQVGRMLGVPGEAESLQRGRGALGDLGRAQAASPQRERDVLLHRWHDDLVVGVGEDETNPAAHLPGLLHHVEAVDRHGPAARRDEPVDHPSQGRLAGPVRADDPDSVLGEADRCPAAPASHQNAWETPAKLIVLIGP
jgi:hypothetical protein